MIPLNLIHAHHEAMVDATYHGALLGIESIRRISQYSLASRRQQLGNSGLLADRPELPLAGQHFFAMGSHALSDCRHAIEVAGDAYGQWTDLCQTHLHLAHDRMQAAITYLADHGPGEAKSAMHLAQMGNDLTFDAADRIAGGSKATVTEAVAEIASTLPAKSGRRRPAVRTSPR